MDSELGEDVASVTGCSLVSNTELVRDSSTGEAANEKAHDFHFTPGEVKRVHRIRKHFGWSLSGPNVLALSKGELIGYRANTR